MYRRLEHDFAAISSLATHVLTHPMLTMQSSSDENKTYESICHLRFTIKRVVFVLCVAKNNYQLLVFKCFYGDFGFL